MSPTRQALDSTRRAFGQALFGPTSRWVLLAATVGVCAGVTAVAFRWLLEFCTEKLFKDPTGIATEGFASAGPNWWMLLLIPTGGGLLVGLLVQKLAPEAEGHGTDSVVRAYHRLKGEVRQRVIYVKAIASALTIGTGGSAGQEGPVAQIGAGIGSTIARKLKLPTRERRLLLLAGGSAGVGAMFCSPLGGALFMPEVLYRKSDIEGDALIPCIISSIFAYATYTTISGDHRAVELSPELLSSLSFSALSFSSISAFSFSFLFLSVRRMRSLKIVSASLPSVPPISSSSSSSSRCFSSLSLAFLSFSARWASHSSALLPQLSGSSGTPRYLRGKRVQK